MTIDLVDERTGTKLREDRASLLKRLYGCLTVTESDEATGQPDVCLTLRVLASGRRTLRACTSSPPHSLDPLLVDQDRARLPVPMLTLGMRDEVGWGSASMPADLGRI